MRWFAVCVCVFVDYFTGVIVNPSFMMLKYSEYLHMINSMGDYELCQVLVIREKLADLYESEQQWSKAAHMLSGIDLDSAMR